MRRLSRRSVLKGLLALPLALLPSRTLADGPGPGPVYLPLVGNGNGENMASDPILAVCCADGSRIDLLSYEAGFQLDDPGWRPQLPQLKGGGSYSNSMIAEGQTLVAAAFDNVIESIPLTARAYSEEKCLATLAKLWQAVHKASQYWTESSQLESSWLECRPPGCEPDGPIGYSRISKIGWVDYSSPFGQPMFSQLPASVADGLSIVVEREPFWRLVPPGERIGPLYNLLRNPDFEDWNAGVADSQPDCWDDLETFWITGENSRDDSPKWGRYCLKVRASMSVQANGAKGVTQVIEGIEDGQEYTVVVWVRNAGVSNGVGRVLVTSLLGQYEVYRSATQHGWTLYTFVFTAGVGDTVAVNCEILSTAAGCDGAVYFDSLMVLKGDWQQYAKDDLLPYLSSSHIVNHTDSGAGHLNHVDVWNVPGDVDALVRLEAVNDTEPLDFTNVVEKIGRLRIGQRRTGDVQNFQDYHDPAGVADATASNGDRVNFTPTPDWVNVTTHAIVGEGDVADNVGRFRVLARLYDAKGAGSPTLEARLAYWLGVSQVGVKYLTGAALPQRATWNMVNLTGNAAAIMDSKFRANYPGALTYSLQLRRPTGTGDARLDYLLSLPTDGGYLEAEINPPLEQGVALVADNTASMSVAATGVRAGYVLRQTTTDFQVTDFQAFNGTLYASFAADVFGSPGGIWRRQGGTWVKVYNSGTGAVTSLEVWNGKLYALMSTTTPNVKLLSSQDGVAWSVVATIAMTNAYDLKSYNGLLWAGVGDADGKIYTWDGATFALNYTVPGAPQHNPAVFEVWRDRLYFGTCVFAPGRVYEYTPGTGWALLYETGEDYIYSLRAFKGKLYAGTASQGRIFSYDGSVWTMVRDASTLGHVSAIQSMAVRDDVLLAISNVTGAVLSKLYQSEDGDTWSEFYDPGSLDSLYALTVFEGDIFMGVLTAPGPSGYIYVLVPGEPFEYGVSNYQGGPFTAPNRQVNGDTRRHRWIVSVDRSDGSNWIDDRLLIGLAFVPRYAIIPSKR